MTMQMEMLTNARPYGFEKGAAKLQKVLSPLSRGSASVSFIL